MGAAKQIKQVMIERGVNVAKLADLLEIKPQSMSNKLFRDTFTYAEVERIADKLQCDIRIITRDTGKQF